MRMPDRPVQLANSRAADGSPAPASAADEPLVSIVTPSYNQGRFIRATILSVLGQDYPRIEYWVIDGGSTDETLAILREFEHDPRLHWLSEPDRGQSDAINRGLARCTGELFAWVNTDDLLLPGAIRHVVDTWLAGGRAALVYGRARLIDASGADLGYCPAQSSAMTLDQLLQLRYFLPQPATFAPTATVRAVGGVDVELHYAMDLDLWIKLAARLPIQYAPFDLAQFRLHPASKTVALSSRFIGDVAAVLDRAAVARLLPQHQARVRAQIFAIRTYLTPEVGDLRAAFASMFAACRAEPRVLPEALFVLAKALVRLVVGESVWSWVRYLQVRLS
jgi:glycosyltransferase involved in cell wall biosynthesis